MISFSFMANNLFLIIITGNHKKIYLKHKSTSNRSLHTIIICMKSNEGYVFLMNSFRMNDRLLVSVFKDSECSGY